MRDTLRMVDGREVGWRWRGDFDPMLPPPAPLWLLSRERRRLEPHVMDFDRLECENCGRFMRDIEDYPLSCAESARLLWLDAKLAADRCAERVGSST